MVKGKINYKELSKFQKQIEKMAKNDKVQQEFMESCAKELAARLLSLVIQKTPVHDYSHEITVTAKRDSKNHKKGEQYTKRVNTSGKTGGTLRRGWTAKTEKEAESGSSMSAKEYAESLNITKTGDLYTVEIVNPVHYASYVEYGHRTRNHNGWVSGKFMLTKSEIELNSKVQGILEKKIKKYMEEQLNGN